MLLMLRMYGSFDEMMKGVPKERILEIVNMHFKRVQTQRENVKKQRATLQVAKQVLAKASADPKLAAALGLGTPKEVGRTPKEVG